MFRKENCVRLPELLVWPLAPAGGTWLLVANRLIHKGLSASLVCTPDAAYPFRRGALDHLC